MAVSINWIPVEERLPDEDDSEEVMYVTYENPVTGRRSVRDFVCFIDGKWVDLHSYNAFENKKRRVVAWSKDTVDILPY